MRKDGVGGNLNRLLRRLLAQRATMIRYLDMRRALEDWHGVQDAASDIREIEAKLSMVRAGRGRRNRNA